MKSRIKMLREKRGLIQEILAVEIGITQQMLSKYERDITVIKVDVLKRLAKYFNVTTDYLLGVSDVKRDLTGQIRMNETLDEYYDLIEVYRRMDKYDREKCSGRSCSLLEKLLRKEGGIEKVIKVAICDDDVATTGKIESMLYGIVKGKFIQIDIEVFWKGKHLEKAVKNNACFDIIFLDIEMEGEDGITVAKRIRETDKNVLIVYVTSYESYMQESFSVRPFRFLVKPVGEVQMAACFEAAFEEISSADSYFRYNYQRLNRKILIRDIYYFESRRRKVYITTEKEVLEFYGKLNEIEKSLKASKGIFLRVHQSFLVNYKHIEGLAYDFIVMDNGKRISISEDRRKRIGEQYCEMEDTFYVDM